MHFTYVPLEPDQLRQGDVLRRTPEIDALLQDIHHHYYQQSDYRYFIVLTQSCDLERRGVAPCKARYISLAAVRPLVTAVRRELDRYRSDIEIQGRFANLDNRRRIEDFVRQLLNNNASAYFYLHEDLELGFPESCCAFLRLSVAIRAMEHYQKCLDAKILQLDDQFQAKLGWMVGNLYSRVGTDDWIPQGDPTEVEMEERIRRIVERDTVWVSDKLAGRLKRALRERGGPIDENVVAEEINRIGTIPSRKEMVVGRVAELLGESNIDQEVVNMLVKRMTSDPQLAPHLKER